MQPWQRAWQQALYGPGGFYRRPEGPAGHFRTATHAAPQELVGALVRLAGEHGCRAVVDVGAGRGELLRALAGGGTELRLHGVDVVDRPPDLPAEIGWTQGLGRLPAGTLAGALVVAWELLDVVPCPVIELDDDGVARLLEVDLRGVERPAGSPDPLCAAWQRRWWPLERPGDRAELGHPRDRLWTRLVRRAGADARAAGHPAVLLAVDYGHLHGQRPATGTLTGYRAGRAVPPRPDGSCDLTAQVAIDAVAAAGQDAGAGTLTLTRQHSALRALGLTGRAAPGRAARPLEPASATRPQDLAAAGREAELLDPGGLGGFWWLLQRVPV